MASPMTENAGTLTIPLEHGLVGRLFGVPFLAAGLWFAYQLVASAIGVIRLGPSEAVAYLPGLVLLLVMGAAFLVPGWLLALTRSRVQLNPLTGTVVEERDLRVRVLRKNYRLSDFDRISVGLLKVSSKSDRAGAGYEVELRGDGGRSVLLGLFDDDEQALAHAEALASRLQLRVEDRCRADESGESDED
jgi:hypothetical protein